jgi:hypothetical protein
MKITVLPKVKRSSFTRLSASGLSEFTHGVVNATKGIEAYKIIETPVNDLTTALKNLDTINAERFNAGKLDTQKRNIAVSAVLEHLQQIARMLEAHANGSADFLVNAGFQCIAGGGAHRPVQLSVPVITQLRPTLVPSQIEVNLAKCRGARSFAFEFSYDNGTVWHNGAYASKLRNKFTVNTNQEVMVRTKAIGAGAIVSDFCAPLTCKVL